MKYNAPLLPRITRVVLWTNRSATTNHQGCPLNKRIWATTLNQRTSGPVNAHLTPGPGIYFNAFIHVYSPRAGADNPLGANVDFNTLSLCPFVASFKTISLKYDFKHILNDFIHVYSPRAGADNPLGTKFWCQQKFLITLPICCQFEKNLFEVWFFTVFYVCFFTCI